MALVLVAKQAWGVQFRTVGDNVLAWQNLACAIDTTVYSLDDTGSPPVASFTTNDAGELPGWIEEGGPYALTVNGVTTEVWTTTGALAASVESDQALVTGALFYMPPPSSAAIDTPALIALNDAALAAGGGTIMLSRAPLSTPYQLNDVVEIDSLVNLVGAGIDATVFLLTTAAARLKFLTGAGGLSQGFTVNGGTVSAPVAEVGIEVGIVNHRSFRDIKIHFTLNDGLLLVGTQNCTFDNVQSYWHFGNAYSITNSAGANQFFNCGGGRVRGWIVSVRQTASDPGIGSAQPLGNMFWGGIFEYTSNQGVAALGVVEQTAGINTTFNGTQLVRGTDAPGASVVNLSKQATFGVTTSTMSFINCISLISDYTGHHFLLGAGTKLHIGGASFAPTGGESIFSLSTSSFVETDARLNPAAVGSPLGTLIDPSCAAAAPAAWTALIRHKRNVVHEITVPTTSISAVMTYVAGDTQPRAQLLSSSLGFSSGSAAVDALIERAGAGWVRSPGLLSAGASAGAAGTGLMVGAGTIIRRWLSGTVVWDPPSIASGAAASTTVTVTGAALGDTVAVGISQAVPGGAIISGAVTAADMVTVTIMNLSGDAIDLANSTVRADVHKH